MCILSRVASTCSWITRIPVRRWRCCAIRPADNLTPGAQQRFLFALKLQMARINWLLNAAAEGQALNLVETSEPTLFLANDGRLGVNVDLRVDHQAATTPDVVWKFSCQDPSWYWVSEFIQPESPVMVTGCAHPTLSPAVKVATGPLAGSVHVDVQCAS